MRATLLLPLVVVAACGRGVTTPAESEALARAIESRIEALRDVDRRTGAFAGAELVLYRSLTLLRHDLLPGAAGGLGLDTELVEIFDDYWTDLPDQIADLRDGESSGLEILPQVRRLHADAFRRYHDRLRARIDADAKETAARGLLATAVWVNLVRTPASATRYHVVDVLNEILLAGQFPLQPAPGCPCPVYAPTPCLENDLRACQGAPDDLARVRFAAEERVNRWLGEIETIAPDSAWLIVARSLAAEAGGPLHEQLTQTEQNRLAACVAPPTDAIVVRIDRERIYCDDAPVLELEAGQVAAADLSSGGMLVEPLHWQLTDAIEHRQRVYRYRRRPAEPSGRDPRYAAHLGKGLTFRDEKRYDEALAEFEQAVGIESGPEVYEAVGLMWIEQGHAGQAVTQLREAAALYERRRTPRPDLLAFYDRVLAALEGAGEKRRAADWAQRRAAAAGAGR